MFNDWNLKKITEQVKDTYENLQEKCEDGYKDLKKTCENAYEDVSEKICYTKTTEKIEKQLQENSDLYNKRCEKLKNYYKKLNDIRENSSNEIFPLVESYINTLANSPKEFSNCFKILGFELQNYNNKFSHSDFNDKTDEVNNEKYTDLVILLENILGVSLIMADLKSFGLATLLCANVYKKFKNNKDKITQAKQQIKYQKVEITKIEIAIEKINKNIKEINKFRSEFLTLVTYLQNKAPKNYSEFNQTQKHQLQALTNNINSFSKLLNQIV